MGGWVGGWDGVEWGVGGCGWVGGDSLPCTPPVAAGTTAPKLSVRGTVSYCPTWHSPPPAASVGEVDGPAAEQAGHAYALPPGRKPADGDDESKRHATIYAADLRRALRKK